MINSGHVRLGSSRYFENLIVPTLSFGPHTLFIRGPYLLKPQLIEVTKNRIKISPTVMKRLINKEIKIYMHIF